MRGKILMESKPSSFAIVYRKCWVLLNPQIAAKYLYIVADATVIDIKCSDLMASDWLTFVVIFVNNRAIVIECYDDAKLALIDILMS